MKFYIDNQSEVFCESCLEAHFFDQKESGWLDQDADFYEWVKEIFGAIPLEEADKSIIPDGEPICINCENGQDHSL